MGSEYDDVPLDRSAQADLQVLVDGYAALWREALERAAIDERICAIAIDHGDEGLDVTPRVFAGREADRAAALRNADGDWLAAWDPYHYRDEEDAIDPDVDHAPPELADAWRRFAAAVEGRIVDPPRWVLSRVAHRLNRQPLPLALTEDAIVYVFDPEFGDDLIDQLEYVGRPETIAALRAGGLLGDRESEDLSF